MTFQDKYPHLYNFLACNFPPDEFGLSSEEDVIRSFVAPGVGYEEALEEMIQILQEVHLPVDEISHAACYLFDDEAEARSWLQNIADLMTEELSKPNGS